MIASIVILLALPVLDTGRIRGSSHRPHMKAAMSLLLGAFIILLVLGSYHVELPYTTLAAYATAIYFGIYLFIIPVIGFIDNTIVASPTK